MRTSIILNGGAGRVLTAIPALEKFYKTNTDFNVFVYGWESLLWGHPILQNKVFSIGQKGIFDAYLRGSNILMPEPYFKNSYITQQKHMIEVFDEELNNTNDHSDLSDFAIYLSKDEIQWARTVISKKISETGKSDFIVFQPYGSGLGIRNNRPVDMSARSVDVDDYLRLVSILSEKSTVLFFGEEMYKHPGDHYSCNIFDESPTLRHYAAIISQCDYFIGCDSVGQHIAKAFNKPGLILMGATFEQNVSYPNHFNIYRNGHKPVYSPIRLSSVDCEFADRLNEKCMMYTEQDIQNIVQRR
jgi:ADP-heptose:LPS heptosyltransferase